MKQKVKMGKPVAKFRFNLTNILIIIAIIAAFIGICTAVYYEHKMNEGNIVIENDVLHSIDKTQSITN